MSEELLINVENGSVKIPFLDGLVSFEVIEKVYLKILPLLKKRREAGFVEGASKK